jgi:hypothetical protein
MKEYEPDYEYRQGTAFSDLFIQPLALIVQPLRDEANEIYLNQSLKRILDLENPDDYPEEAVDDILSNIYVYRRTGSRAAGSVRVYFEEPKDLTYLPETLEFTNDKGYTYTNINSISITQQEMNNNVEQEFYYVDVAIQSSEEGIEYETAAGAMVGTGESDAVRVFNEFPISGGVDSETNTEFIARAQKSIGVRDLNTGKGFNAIMFETFLNKIVELQPIGFNDPEMMRDIVFNYHVGGRIDGWVKTPSILDGSFNAIGLNVDFTRRLTTTRNLPLYGTEYSEFGVQNIDVTEQSVEGYNIDELEQAAVFYSGIDLDGGIDLSINQFIGIAIDDQTYTNVKIAGALPSTTRAGEIVNRINVAAQQPVASIAVNPVVVSRRRTGAIPTGGDNTLYDPTPRIFSNLFPGDRLSVTTGPNAGSYDIVNIVSENEIEVDVLTPFPANQEEVNYTINRIGTFVKIQSQTKSRESRVFVGSPNTGTDALLDAFGLAPQPNPYEYQGTGKYEYTEGVDFEVDLLNGKVRRIIGPFIVPDTATGAVSNSIFFEDPSTDVFLNVEPGDMITIIDSLNDDIEKDYRVLEKLNNQKLRIDSFIADIESNLTYRITRTGIKDSEYVLFSFQFNPLSIDIGNQVQLDEFGRERGIRPGREDQTITDLAYLWTTSIELIDPVSGEPSGEVLDGIGGYGQGGYGQGGYGIGSRSQYRILVNIPEHRYSAFEDSLISIDTAFLGQSFRVNYKYVPEILEFDAFARSDEERVLDADVLMKHFIPAVVDVEATYTIDPTNPLTASEEDVKEAIVKFIDTLKAGENLDASDINQVIMENIDQSRTRRAKIEHPISMRAVIYNTDGTRTILESTDSLAVPDETIPPYTTRPLSPRTSHWIAGEITLNVIDPGGVGVF